MNIETTASFTGHRPNKLPGGYNPKSKENNKLLLGLREIIIGHIEHANVDTFISGMALGIDIWAARIILALRKNKYPHIKLVAAVPCKNQSRKWPNASKKEWQEIIDQCGNVNYVSKEEFTPWCMQDRNVWMIDHSEFVIAVWNGSKGGTANCVEYAEKQNKIITRLDPGGLK